MSKINDLSQDTLYVGRIKDIARERINLIVIYIEINKQLFPHKLWGHCIDTTNYTQDQFEEYLESEDKYLLNKFFWRFNIDFEDKDILINRKCLCEKSVYKKKPYLRILRIA